MSMSMYRASAPLFLQILPALSACFDKAAAYAAAKKVDPAVLLQSRLFPDMFPLIRQVQICTDMCKGGMARLAGQDPPKWDDNEVTIDDVKARIAKTVAFVKSFTPAQIDGSEGRDISLTLGGQKREFKGEEYLVSFVLPNFYFHATTCYALLRHNGVELGKGDFLRAPG